jgi:hypothetical protein
MSEALSKYTESGGPFSGSVDPLSAGNGSLMRLVPVPLAYRANPEPAIHYAGESSRTTHGAPAAVLHLKRFQGGFQLEEVPVDEIVPEMQQAAEAMCSF